MREAGGERMMLVSKMLPPAHSGEGVRSCLTMALSFYPSDTKFSVSVGITLQSCSHRSKIGNFD